MGAFNVTLAGDGGEVVAACECEWSDAPPTRSTCCCS